jgi:hypothetical protein
MNRDKIIYVANKLVGKDSVLGIVVRIAVWIYTIVCFSVFWFALFMYLTAIVMASPHTREFFEIVLKVTGPAVIIGFAVIVDRVNKIVQGATERNVQRWKREQGKITVTTTVTIDDPDWRAAVEEVEGAGK